MLIQLAPGKWVDPASVRSIDVDRVVYEPGEEYTERVVILIGTDYQNKIFVDTESAGASLSLADEIAVHVNAESGEPAHD